MEAKVVMNDREFGIEVKDTDGFFEDDVLEGERVGKYQMNLVGSRVIKEMEE